MRNPSLASALVALSAFAAGCRPEERAAAAPAEAAAPAASATAPASATTAAPPSSTAEAGPTGDGALEIAGDLRPIRAADLSFKIPGRLATVHVRRGDRVRAGQAIASLSDREARAAVAQADAAARAAEAQAALAADAEARAGSLVATNAAPESQAVTARLQADAARAQVQQARAVLDLARATLDNHVVRAPFAGLVVGVPDGAGATLGPGTVIARVEALDRLVLRGTVGEADLPRVAVGDAVTIDGGPAGVLAAGRVTVVVRSLDPASRRAPVEVEFDNAGGALVAGAYVRARVAKEAKQP